MVPVKNTAKNVWLQACALYWKLGPQQLPLGNDAAAAAAAVALADAAESGSWNRTDDEEAHTEFAERGLKWKPQENPLPTRQQTVSKR